MRSEQARFSARFSGTIAMAISTIEGDFGTMYVVPLFSTRGTYSTRHADSIFISRGAD